MIAVAWVGSTARADSPRLPVPCRTSTRLVRAAQQLASASHLPSARALSCIAQQAGSSAPSVRAWQGPTFDAPALREWLLELDAVADAPLVCGAARGPSGVVMLAFPRGGHLELQPGHALRVQGRLFGSFHSPRLVLRDAKGRLKQWQGAERALREGVRIGGPLMLPTVVQLLANGPAGPRPVARLVLPASEEAAAATCSQGRGPAHQAECSDTKCRNHTRRSQKRPGAPQEPTAPMWRDLNHHRSRYGSGSLRYNRKLSRVAARHAARVCQTAQVRHRVGAAGGPVERLRNARMRAQLVGEAVARAAGKQAAFAEVVHSPSHFSMLVDGRFTDGGLAVAQDGSGHACLVVLLARWPQIVP